MNFVFAITLLGMCLAQVRLMVPSENPTRFQKILLPKDNNFYYRARVFDQQIYRAPRVKTSETIDMCTDMINQVWSDLPTIFNNTLIKNPCARYFCDTPVPLYLKLSNSSSLSSFQQNEALRTHLSIHRYCIQCDLSFAERFDLHLTKNTCPHFDGQYCNNKCAMNSTCVYFRPELNLCHVKDLEVFFHRVDDLHLHFLPLYTFWSSLIAFVTGILMIFVLIFLITIPDIVKTIKTMRSPEWLLETSNKCIGVFYLLVTVKNFNVTCMYLNALQMIILNFLDISDLADWNGRFRNIGNSITITLYVAVFSITLIQWLHLSSVVGEAGLSLCKKLSVALLFGLLIVWGIIGAALYGVGTGIKDNVGWYMDRYIPEGIWFFLSAFWVLIATTALVISGSLILRKVLAIDLTTKTQMEITRILLQIKLTKAMLIFAGVAFVSQFMFVYFGMVYSVNPDVLTYFVFFIATVIVNVWIAILCLLLVIPVYEQDSFLFTYCSCCVKKDENGKYTLLPQKEQ